MSDDPAEVDKGGEVASKGDRADLGGVRFGEGGAGDEICYQQRIMPLAAHTECRREWGDDSQDPPWQSAY